ncbi:MAG TPA: 3-oxoacyl-ACP reductase [Verrucomicrobiales bacterium]|nr:3-oxoacyl-ACP reductase [Verrucomicrobiales bacterium]
MNATDHGSGRERQPEVVLLTGASTGLGLAISRELLRREFRLILTARSESMHRFSEAGIVENERVWLRPLNITHEAERRQVVAEADRHWGGVDVLINNAGVAFRAVVEHVEESQRRAQLDVNFRAPMELIRLVLPHMREVRGGRILNVSSVGGMMAMPTMAVYSASKFALEGMTESLWYEVRPWNIRVSLIQPGFIRSTSFQRTRYTDLSDAAQRTESDPYFPHYRHMSAFIARCMQRAGSTPEHVARVVMKTLDRRKPPLRVAGTMDAWLFDLVRRFLPRTLYHAILYRGLPRVNDWGR